MWLSPEEWQAVALSARVALCATLVCLPTGIAVAYLLARRRFPGKFLLDALVQMPMVLPPVVPGYLLLLGTQGPIGGWLKTHFGIVIAFTWQGAALASATMAFPLMVQPVRLALRMIDGRLEQAASTLGAPPWRVFLTVTLPLATPGLAMGLSVAWARAMGAFGAVIIIAYHPFGIPLQIYTTLQETGLASALPFALVLLVVALPLPLAAYIWSARAERRRRG